MILFNKKISKKDIKRLFLLGVVAFLGVPSSKGDNYISYHQLIRKAQVHYLNNRIDSCIYIYNQIFTKFPKSYPRDNFVAAQIAASEKNNKYCYAFLEKAILNGVTLHTIIHTPIFNTFLVSPYGLQLKLLGDSLSEISKQNIDFDLQKKCIRLALEDQKNLRVQYTFLGRLFHRKAEKKYYASSELIFDTVVQIIIQQGYLGAHKIGIGQDTGFTPLVGNRNLSDHFLSSILYHYPNAAVDLGQMLLTEVQKGNLHPLYYAMIIDYKDKYSQLSETKSKYPYGIVFTNKHQDTTIQNNNRRAIGLLSIEEENKLKSLATSKGIDVYLNPFR